MKKFLSVILSTVLIFTMCFAVNASDTPMENEVTPSENVYSEDGYYYTTKGVIVGIDPEFKTSTGRRSVPSKVGINHNIDVVAIGDYAYENTDMIDDIFIPDTVETIGEGAFKGSSVKSIEFGYNIKSIGKDAFADCELESVHFKGTEKQFQNVQVSEGNEELIEKITYSTKRQVTQRRFNALQTKAGENVEFTFLALASFLATPVAAFVFPPIALITLFYAPASAVVRSYQIVAEFFEIISDHLFRI